VELQPRPAKEQAAGKKGGLAPILILGLLLALAGGAFAAWKFWLNPTEPARVAENTNATQQENGKEPPREEAQTPPQEENKASPQEESKIPPKPALAQAREHLAGKADPAESVSLAETLRAETDGADASFLLLEDAAQKGNAEAMLLTGGYYDPADRAPAGSIKKDPAEALSWYKKAQAAGSAEAVSRIAALRIWVQAEAARGSFEARDLLPQF
jgi:TPR repeat protein